jgi:Holliday junction DNA helicase RuvA
MIGRLHGHIVERNQPGKIVLEVNGVGYDVETSLTSFFQTESMSEKVVLHIHTVIREDAFLLYGFITLEERELFRALIKVNGIGPKMAITILSSITPSEFAKAIQSKDSAYLTKLPGVGKKTAERLVIEMQDGIINSLNPSISEPNQTGPNRDQREAINALISLGFKPIEVEKVVKRIDDGSKNCEQLIRQALQVLSKI